MWSKTVGKNAGVVYQFMIYILRLMVVVKVGKQ